MTRKSFGRLLIAAAATTLAAGSAAASAQTTEAVAVGQQVPAFEALGSEGERYAPSQVQAGDKRLVLIFFRGAW